MPTPIDFTKVNIGFGADVTRTDVLRGYPVTPGNAQYKTALDSEGIIEVTVVDDTGTALDVNDFNDAEDNEVTAFTLEGINFAQLGVQAGMMMFIGPNPDDPNGVVQGPYEVTALTDEETITFANTGDVGLFRPLHLFSALGVAEATPDLINLDTNADSAEFVVDDSVILTTAAGGTPVTLIISTIDDGNPGEIAFTTAFTPGDYDAPDDAKVTSAGVAYATLSTTDETYFGADYAGATITFGAAGSTSLSDANTELVDGIFVMINSDGYAIPFTGGTYASGSSPQAHFLFDNSRISSGGMRSPSKKLTVLTEGYQAETARLDSSEAFSTFQDNDHPIDDILIASGSLNCTDGGTNDDTVVFASALNLENLGLRAGDTATILAKIPAIYIDASSTLDLTTPSSAVLTINGIDMYALGVRDTMSFMLTKGADVQTYAVATIIEATGDSFIFDATSGGNIERPNSATDYTGVTDALFGNDFWGGTIQFGPPDQKITVYSISGTTVTFSQAAASKAAIPWIGIHRSLTAAAYANASESNFAAEYAGATVSFNRVTADFRPGVAITAVNGYIKRQTTEQILGHVMGTNPLHRSVKFESFKYRGV